MKKYRGFYRDMEATGYTLLEVWNGLLRQYNYHVPIKKIILVEV
jgi:hypothetical protein